MQLSENTSTSVEKFEIHRWTMLVAKAAAREARQEAGVIGKVYRKPVGFYRYRKVMPNENSVPERGRIRPLGWEAAEGLAGKKHVNLGS